MGSDHSVRAPAPRTVLVAMTAALAMVFIDQTGVAVALPSIRGELGLNEHEYAWVVNAYTLAIAASAITLGRLSDQLGHPRGAVASIVCFALGSALAGAAQSPEWLIGARALQGLGGGMMTSSLVAIVSEAYPEQRRGRALGLYWGIAGLALSGGPLLAGVVTSALGWRWVFWVNPAIALLVIAVLIPLALSSRERRPEIRFDYLGSVLLAAGMVSLVLGTHGKRMGLAGVGVILLTVLLVVDRRRDNPLIDLPLVADRLRGTAFLVTALAQPILLWIPLYLSLYLQSSVLLDPLEAGLALLPLTAGLFAGSLLGGRLTDRYGGRLPSLVGAALLLVSLVFLALVVEGGSYSEIAPALPVAGIGLQLTFTPMATTLLNSVGDAKRAVTSGMLGTCRQMGGAIGLAALAAVMVDQGGHASLPSAMHAAVLTQIGLAAVIVVVLLLLPPREAAARDRPSSGVDRHPLRFVHGH